MVIELQAFVFQGNDLAEFLAVGENFTVSWLNNVELFVVEVHVLHCVLGLKVFINDVITCQIQNKVLLWV